MTAIPFGKTGFMPQEEMLAVARKQSRLVIGIPKETLDLEKRVSLTPEAVEILVNNGHEVLIESEAGSGANYSDTDYSERGGFIIRQREEVLKADIILKIAPLNIEDIPLLKGNQLIISDLHINNHTKEYISGVMKKKITAVGFGSIRDEYGAYPIDHSMSAISGTTGIIIAAELLSNNVKGKGVLLGGIPGITPTEVVIFGASPAAESAARAAMGMGAFVKIFDDSVCKLRHIQEKLGQQVYTSIFHPKVLEKAMRSADVVIGAISQLERRNYFKVSEALVQSMKKGSVIVDLMVDQGGCFETSECKTIKDPMFTKHNIVHYCVPNMPSLVARTASIALSNVYTPLLMRLGESGGINPYIKEDAGFRNGIYVYNGILTNNFLGKYYNLPYQDINLLMAAF
jgi:alanine dehydrogenase